MYVINLAYYVLRGIFVFTNNLYCIPTYLVWMLLLTPIRLFSEKMYWRIEGQLFYWLLTMVGYWSYSAGYDIIETGVDMIPKIINEECLVLVNHQSTSDVPLLMAAFSTRNHLLQNLNWIMDGIYLYTHFGVVSALHGDFFVPYGAKKRRFTLESLETYLRQIYSARHRKWLVLFPEGGFLRNRRETGHRYALKNKLPILNHVTLPRMGAIQTIMDTIGPNSDIGVENASSKLKYVVDMTIAYPQGKPLGVGSVIFGYSDACEIRMHYRVFPVENIPRKSEKLQDWVYDRYIEKECLLDYYYKTGVWEPKVIELCRNTSVYTQREAKVADGVKRPLSVHEMNRRGSALVGDGRSQINNCEITLDPLIELLGPGSPYETTRLKQNQTENEITLPLDEDGENNNSNMQVEETPSEVIAKRSQIDEVILPYEGEPEVCLDFIIPPFEKTQTSSLEIGRKYHQGFLRICLIHVLFMLSTAFHSYSIYFIGYFIYSSFKK